MKMTGGIKDMEDETKRIDSMLNSQWMLDEVAALAQHFQARGLASFEGALVMSKLTSVALASCVQFKEENKDGA
jgi:hypothetical protein